MNNSKFVSRIQKYFGIEVISFTDISKDDIRIFDDKNVKKSYIDENYICNYRITNLFYYYFI
jgi:hypothetical protein